MPWDGIEYITDYRVKLPKEELERRAIALLERGLKRVTAGYCPGPYYKPKTWWRNAPKFCMRGSLNCGDDGHWDVAAPYDANCLAEEYLLRATGGKSLVEFGTRPFARGRVIRAYKTALAAARAELINAT